MRQDFLETETHVLATIFAPDGNYQWCCDCRFPKFRSDLTEEQIEELTDRAPRLSDQSVSRTYYLARDGEPLYLDVRPEAHPSLVHLIETMMLEAQRRDREASCAQKG
jgi:hypothetical protein